MSVANPFLKLKVRLYTPAGEAFKAELPLSLCNLITWIISKLRSRLRGFERQNTAVIWDDEGTWTKPLVGIKCERINKSILCLSDWWPAETGERWGQCGPFHWCAIKKNKWKKTKTNPHSSNLDNELELSRNRVAKTWKNANEQQPFDTVTSVKTEDELIKRDYPQRRAQGWPAAD